MFARLLADNHFYLTGSKKTQQCSRFSVDRHEHVDVVSAAESSTHRGSVGQRRRGHVQTSTAGESARKALPGFLHPIGGLWKAMWRPFDRFCLIGQI